MSPFELSDEEQRAITYLRTPRAIRDRCGEIFDQGLQGGLEHFRLRLDRLPEVTELVLEVTRRTYPRLNIPDHSRWNHFRAGGVDRVSLLNQKIAALDLEEQARCRFDLTVTSVLLDAGAGAEWRYHEAESGQTFSSSEGLAVASFRLFVGGAFSAREDQPLRADAEALEAFTETNLARAFQVGDGNRLEGLTGRARLIRSLSSALRERPEIFGSACPRVGNLFDYLQAQTTGGVLGAPAILRATVDGFGSIWPGRLAIGAVNLGDVWRHQAVSGTGPRAGLVPFHKLCQWLTYSLIGPLQAAAIRLVELDELTGLAEYRNGGLFVDTGVLEPTDPQITSRAHSPASEIVVEWRALTVALLDRVREAVARQLGTDLPLVKVLEGGTWSAGREVAKRKRPDGRPPIQIESDGTVF